MKTSLKVQVFFLIIALSSLTYKKSEFVESVMSCVLCVQSIGAKCFFTKWHHLLLAWHVLLVVFRDLCEWGWQLINCTWNFSKMQRKTFLLLVHHCRVNVPSNEPFFFTKCYLKCSKFLFENIKGLLFIDKTVPKKKAIILVLNNKRVDESRWQHERNDHNIFIFGANYSLNDSWSLFEGFSHLFRIITVLFFI